MSDRRPPLTTHHSPSTTDASDRRKASEDISTSYLVEAGAGTGKTTVLLNRILSIVRSGRARLDEIAAITFTEKAAGELKMRLRAELEKAAAEPVGWAAPTAGSGGHSPPYGLEHVQQALQDLERAQVSTIHSFCAGMLRELPVEAKVDPGFRVADQLMASLLLSDVWARWLEKQMSGENPALRMAIELGAGLEDDIEALARELAMNRDILEGAPKPIESLNLAEFVERFRRDVARLLELAKSCLRPEEDGCYQQIRRLRTVANQLKALADAQLQVVLFRDIVIKPREGNQNNWKPKSKCAEAKAILGEMKDAQDALKQAIAHNALARLVECLRGFVAAYEEAKREANLLDFQDLLLLARDMLRNSRAARDYFKRRFRFILLDEFQDTDPLQAEVAFFLAEQGGQHADDWATVAVEPGKLFLVGDPKQSIYRFRRADIEMYHQGRARLEASSQSARSGTSVLHITENFRCAPQIVDWVNAAFASLIQKSADGDYQPEYVPLVAHERETPPGAGVVLLWPEDRREAPDAAQVRADEAQHIASFVKRAVQDGWQVWDKADRKLRPLRYSDVAVLFRAQSYLEVYEDAMRDQDVPYRVAGGKAFYKRQEIKSLLAVLSALDSPQDAVALVAALRTPFLGVSDEELFLFRQSGGQFSYLASPPTDAPQSVADALKLLRELYEKRNAASVTRLLQELLDRTKALELFRLKPQGEQRVANLLKVLDTSRALEDTGIITFRGFVRWVRQLERTEEEEA
ncbi:MAG: hypothetical protein FJ272_09350, partial [Planctomycetes bacterium]|nr:hypothetical protein [Planctomycetota bacterium]